MPQSQQLETALYDPTVEHKLTFSPPHPPINAHSNDTWRGWTGAWCLVSGHQLLATCPHSKVEAGAGGGVGMEDMGEAGSGGGWPHLPHHLATEAELLRRLMAEMVNR